MIFLILQIEPQLSNTLFDEGSEMMFFTRLGALTYSHHLRVIAATLQEFIPVEFVITTSAHLGKKPVNALVAKILERRSRLK